MKFNFTKNEVKELYDSIYFSDIQKRILEYRLLDYSIVKISDIEHCSVSTINREIRKIKYKIKKYNQIVAKNWQKGQKNDNLYCEVIKCIDLIIQKMNKGN